MKEKLIKHLKITLPIAILAMAILLLPVRSYAIKYGSCGVKSFYLYNESSKTLSFLGTGAINSCKLDENECYEKAPWSDFEVETLKISNGITAIGGGCLQNWDNKFSFTEVTLPSSITLIGDSAFNGNDKLKTVNFPSGLKVIGKRAFRYTGLTSVTIPESVAAVGNDVFVGCENLTSITINNSSVPAYAFEFEMTHSKPITLKLSDKCTSIGEEAFAGCRFPNNRIYIPSTVKTIGHHAFGFDIGDDPVYIKNGLTIVGANNSAAFNYAKKHDLTFITNGYKSKPIKKVSNVKKRKMKITWSRDKKASGYQIQYSTSSTFASGNKATSIGKNQTTSKTISGLKKGKTYYVRIRCYKTISGKKCYSEWSTVKKVKIKK